MEKTTILARVQFTIAFTEQTIGWMDRNCPDVWFAREDGSPFLQEFGHTWRELIETKINHEVHGYFHELGVPPDSMPYVSHGETYKGSWIMDAAIVMKGSVGNSYSILKQAHKELPEIAAGLSGLKAKIQKEVEPSLTRAVSESLYSTASNTLRRNVDSAASATSSLQLQPLPSKLITTNFVIDARPLASLTPSLLKSHKIHLSVGVSRDSFTLENLGDDPLHDVQLGVFKARTSRNQWSYQESYQGKFPLVSGHQTMVKQVGEFIDKAGNRLDLSGSEEVYVDCWVQDSHGIYLFQFLLEEP